MDTITQAELQEVQNLWDRGEQLENELKRRVLAGAEVEPGELTADEKTWIFSSTFEIA